MKEANFYAVYHGGTPKILATLLDKALSIQGKCGVIASDNKQAEELNKVLWSCAQWLPHCMINDKIAEQTPIVISVEAISKDIDFLFLVDFAVTDNYNYKKIFVVFDANDPEILDYNRGRWKSYINKDIKVTFYKQNNLGKFEPIGQ